MRLPLDATLLLSEGVAPALVEVWREERLPTAEVADATAMDALATATVVACDPALAEMAAGLGFRTFLVGEAPAPEGARVATVEEAWRAVRAARALANWKASRRASG